MTNRGCQHFENLLCLHRCARSLASGSPGTFVLQFEVRTRVLLRFSENDITGVEPPPVLPFGVFRRNGRILGRVNPAGPLDFSVKFPPRFSNGRSSRARATSSSVQDWSSLDPHRFTVRLALVGSFLRGGTQSGVSSYPFERSHEVRCSLPPAV